ncbi:hypothetical protein E1286_05055 [Nonomuraea terrae]|uniref:Uncharacterized protein n=1 Tax=Nonomuraea terrae TaxID=2530383 RepID=A0A4R4ZDW7_9ACTN|nr:hypothetical protein [Nonomuraea terrae]TDD54562.1 hypothetical protein E1286_05055 [Nonomuraea terrae]
MTATLTAPTTIRDLIARRDQVQREIEADLRSEGIDPEAGDWEHPRNEEWLQLHEAVENAVAQAVSKLRR